MRKAPGFFIALLVLSACAAMLPQVSPMQAEWAAHQWPGMDAAQLEEARALYAARCSGCHNVILPKENSIEEWDVMLNKMAPKAKINEQEKETIRRYIVSAIAVPPVK